MAPPPGRNRDPILAGGAAITRNLSPTIRRIGHIAQKARGIKNVFSVVWQFAFGEVVESEKLGPFNAYVEVVYDSSSRSPTLEIGYYEEVRGGHRLRMVEQYNSRRFRVTCPWLEHPDKYSEEHTLANLRKPGTEPGVHRGIQCYAVEATKGTGKQQLGQICLKDFTYIRRVSPSS